MINHMNTILTCLSDHYYSIDSSSTSILSEGETSRMEVDDDDDPQKFLVSQYKAFKQVTQSVECKKEVDKYLMEDCEGVNEKIFNILAWWKSNTSKYSILSRLARDVFVAPVSTMASQQAFSIGEHIFCSSLASDMVQSLICAQNWLQALEVSEHILDPFSIGEHTLELFYRSIF